MRKRLRIIFSAFAVSFVIMISLAIYSLSYYSSLEQYSQKVDHTNTVIEHLYKIENTLKDMDMDERGYMLTHDTTYLNRLKISIDSAYPQTTYLKNMIPNNANEQKKIILIRSDLVLRIWYLKQNLAYLDTAHSTVLSAYYYIGKNKMQDCLNMIDVLHNDEKAQLGKMMMMERLYRNLTSTAIRYLLISFGILTLILFIVMINELKKRMLYQEQLQAKVIDITRSHSELEQIAYAASHDLQEPLRKIQVFGNRLIWVKKDALDEETIDTIMRINNAANRMQRLIEDLVNLTSLTKRDDVSKKINLNDIVQSCIEDLKSRINETQAVIEYGNLPEIYGYEKQLHILFKALLDNSLKFIRAEIRPEISISSDHVNGEKLVDINNNLGQQKFFRITVTDNGIGFDNKFAPKMFQIFQRLHNQDAAYEGKGIGLALCQRIMANHQGYIIAYGQPANGAIFMLFFPVLA